MTRQVHDLSEIAGLEAARREHLLDAAHEVWTSALGNTWHIERSMFDRYAESGAVMMDGDRALGLVLHDPGPETGSIRAIAVHPDVQGHGIGRALLGEALQRLRGALRPGGRMKLGGGYRYLWPGIPEDLSASRGFFETVLGWPFLEPSVDMTMALQDFSPPPGCFQRPAAAGLTFRAARWEDVPTVLAFADQQFPKWSPYFREHAPEDIVVGVDDGGGIVAALVLDMPPVLWSTILGPRTAEIGAVGVDHARHNLGIGTALVTRSCEILRDRDVEIAILRWLYRVSFYAHVGFRVWKRYEVSSINSSSVVGSRKGPSMVW